MTSPTTTLEIVPADQRARGQRRLTNGCTAAICRAYGWHRSQIVGYEDNGRIYVGSNYAGTVRDGQIILDRNAR